MGRSKIPHKFGSIPERLWDKLKGKEKSFLHKYNYYRKKMIDLDEEIIELKLDIEEKKKEKEKIRKKSEEIWKNHKHLKDDYSVSFNISKNDKYTSIRNRYGYNKEGKSKSQLLDERKFIGRYWLVNVKYKGSQKSIHVGNDDYVKDFLKNDKWVINNTDILGIKNLNKLTEDNIKITLGKLVVEGIYDIVSSGENILDKSIKFKDLL